MDVVIENPEGLKTLISKMIKIMEAVKSIPKNGTHPLGYKYCADDDVLEHLRAAMIENGIFMFSSLEEVSQREAGGKGDKINTIIRARTKHTFFCAETGTSLICYSAGEGIDQDCKGLSKAITAAVKKTLMKNFLVPGEKDPESGNGHNSKNKNQGSGDHGHKGHQGGSGNGGHTELTVGTIMNLFQSLGMKKATPAHYRAYLEEKYKIDSPGKMSPEQLREQRDMLESLKSNTGGEGGYQISHFEAHLMEKFSDKKG